MRNASAGKQNHNSVEGMTVVHLIDNYLSAVPFYQHVSLSPHH